MAVLLHRRMKGCFEVDWLAIVASVSESPIQLSATRYRARKLYLNKTIVTRRKVSLDGRRGTTMPAKQVHPAF